MTKGQLKELDDYLISTVLELSGEEYKLTDEEYDKILELQGSDEKLKIVKVFNILKQS